MRGTTCPLCSSMNSRRVYQHPTSSQELHLCQSCGFRFVHPHESWIPSVTDDLDPDDFRFWGSEEARLCWDAWRAVENNRVLEIFTGGTTQGALFEIGFGDGPLTEHLLQHCDEYWGIEPVPSVYRRTVERLNLDPTKALMLRAEDIASHPALSARAGDFGAIVMVSVLEHLSRPRELLRQCTKMLKPGGEMIISVPDSAQFLAQYWLRRVCRLEPWTVFHISFFREMHLQKLFEESGLRIVRRTRNPLVTRESADYFGRLYSTKGLRLLMRIYEILGLNRVFKSETILFVLRKT